MISSLGLREKLRGDAGAVLLRALIAAVLAAAYACMAHRASAGLDVNRVMVPVAHLPEALHGMRIAQVSDLHSSRFGSGQSELIEAVAAFQPELIAITGDFIDGVNPDFEPCKELVRGLAGIAPVYWVRGNHEYYLDGEDRLAFEADMAALGARLLDNQAIALDRRGQRYLLAGMNDIHALRGDHRELTEPLQRVEMEHTAGNMRAINASEPEGDFPFKLMLCHRPGYWQPWRASGYSLALCGHLHGWMFRAAGIGGVLRLPTRYFADEDAGLYDKQGLQIYISRGLANRLSVKNFRMNNRPELTLVEITGQ